MIRGLLGAIFDSISVITRKKALDISKFPKSIFLLFDYIGLIIISLLIILLGKFNFYTIQQYLPMLGITAITGIILLKSSVDQKMYRTNKLSSLLPFGQLSSIISIIVAYFIFGGASFFSFTIAIITIIIISIFSIDFKEFKFPNNFGLVLANATLGASNNILLLLVLKSFNYTEYYIWKNILGVIIIGIAAFGEGGFLLLRNQQKGFYKYRVGSSIFYSISNLISLYLMANFGLIISMMLNFLYNFITIILSFFMLGDKPKLKNIILTIIVCILASIGIYYK